jgi:hypothetical protein
MGIPEFGRAETREYKYQGITHKVTLNPEMELAMQAAAVDASAGKINEAELYARLVKTVFGHKADNFSHEDTTAAVLFAIDIFKSFFPESADETSEDADAKNEDAGAATRPDLG